MLLLLLLALVLWECWRQRLSSLILHVRLVDLGMRDRWLLLSVVLWLWGMLRCRWHILSRLIVGHRGSTHVGVTVRNLGSLADMLELRGAEIRASSANRVHETVS